MITKPLKIKKLKAVNTAGFSLFEIIIALMLLSFSMVLSFKLSHQLLSHEVAIHALYQKIGLENI